MPMNWIELLQVDEAWISTLLNSHVTHRKNKVVTRVYTLKFAGTEYSHNVLAQELSYVLHKYVFCDKEIKKIGEARALKKAEKTFGDKDPSKSGKYGELMLFTLVEAILKCPMVASKIPTSFNDEVKGGDGIFLGEYNYSETDLHPAILIGESKIWKGFSDSVEDSLKSISRFHNNVTSAKFLEQEFLVAKKGLFHDGALDFEYVYNCLTPGAKEYGERIMVHPTLIVYETAKIKKIEKEARIPVEAENALKEVITREKEHYIKVIEEKLKLHPELDPIYLDFFIIPLKDVDAFRQEVYNQIHSL